MKKFLIVLALLFLINPIFAKTVQYVKKYQVNGGVGVAYDVTPAIQSMINMGWRVVSITPVSVKEGYSNPTEYVIVVFEKEE
jgi:hypothetical protein